MDMDSMEKWEQEAIDFKIRTIELSLGCTFEGDSFEEKKAFVAKYMEERNHSTTQMMREAVQEMREEINNKGAIDNGN